jgi:3'(2'), 5'-bisphosphate nucleotidase
MTPPVVDGGFARWLAARAAGALLEVRAEYGHDDPALLASVAGKVSRDVLLTELARWRPADAVLTEHREPGSIDRLGADRVWIVDPLDGTREFSEEGRTDWAVQVALWSRAAGPLVGAGMLVAGALALPALHRVLGTDHPPVYPPLSLPAATGGPLRLASARGRPPARLVELAAALRAELVPLGCTGARIGAVVCGDVDAYVRFTGEYEWDCAGAVVVAIATGLCATRTDGSTLDYNRADPRLPDLLVCRTDLATRLIAELRDAARP